MLEQLRVQHSTLTAFLETLHESPPPPEPGYRITLGIYKHILQDGIAILNTLIRYLSPEA